MSPSTELSLHELLNQIFGKVRGMAMRQGFLEVEEGKRFLPGEFKHE